jgi:serine/threonine-protein kinase
MGAVWRAHDLNLGSAVALKLLDEEYADSSEARTRFEREARAAAALRSSHVVQIIEYGIHADRFPYIAMELLEGETLAERLERAPGGALPPADVCRILTHVARAVGKAHELGIIHRDLKPENIFLVRDDDEETSKVLDFGIAKLANAPREGSTSSHTRTGALLGTPNYMSPEQAHGNKTIDHRSDIWAMGIIAFECICGRAPFRSPALGELVLMICTGPIPKPSSIREVPPAFDAWFLKAASRDADQRFQTAREAASALRAALLGTAESTESSATFRFGLGSDSGSIQVLPLSGESPSAVRPFPRASALNETTGRGALSLLPAEAPSKRGKLAVLGIVGAVVLGLAVWLIAARSSHIPEETPSLSASGAEVSPGGVSAAETLKAATPASAMPARPLASSEPAPNSMPVGSSALQPAPNAKPLASSAIQPAPQRTSAPRATPQRKRQKKHRDDLGI